MFFKKYLKLSAFILLVSLILVNSGNDIKAKKVSNTTYTYYSKQKVHTKNIRVVDGKKLLYTKQYIYSTKGVLVNLVDIIYGRNNKKLAVYRYKYVKKKRLRVSSTYYYNTHLKAKVKTPLAKSYQMNIYDKKGKFAYSLYRTKSGKQKALAAFARKQAGKKYRSGGKGPNSFDCSGLTSYIYKKTTHKNIGSSSYAQNKKGKYIKISTKKLQPGDVLFWGSKRAPYHVGIYLGNGKYIHAGTPRSGVVIKKLNSYKPSYARRLV